MALNAQDAQDAHGGGSTRRPTPAPPGRSRRLQSVVRRRAQADCDSVQAGGQVEAPSTGGAEQPIVRFSSGRLIIVVGTALRGGRAGCVAPGAVTPCQGSPLAAKMRPEMGPAERADAVLGYESLLMAAVMVSVASDGRAVACRAARHRADPGEPALVQCAQAGDLDRLAPGPVSLDGDDPC